MSILNNFRIEKISHITNDFQIKTYLILYVFGKKITLKLFNFDTFLNKKSGDLHYKITRNKEDIDRFVNENMAYLHKAFQINRNFDNCSDTLAFKGICSYCEKKVIFNCEKFPEINNDIMYTETLSCPRCSLFNRLRAVISVFKSFERKSRKLKIYMQEYSTIFYKKFGEMLGSNIYIYIGSEFFGYDKKSGEIVDGVRNENALDLSFNDNEFDYIISNDVLEHVPDADKALTEIVRCLKPGGKMICHIPFDRLLEKTKVRAEIKNGTIVYYEEKEYHGGFSHDDPRGNLAFYTFGLDFFDKLKAAGFKDSYCIAIYDVKYMNIGYEPVFIWIGEK